MTRDDRRAWLREARTLLRSVGVSRPAGAQLRCYVRSVSAGQRPIDVPLVVHRWPQLLWFMEPFDRMQDLSKRLYVAALLVDASSDARRIAYDYQGEGRVKAWLSLAGIVAREAVLLPFRLLLSRR